jgi:hypothetical protein
MASLFGKGPRAAQVGSNKLASLRFAPRRLALTKPVMSLGVGCLPPPGRSTTVARPGPEGDLAGDPPTVGFWGQGRPDRENHQPCPDGGVAARVGHVQAGFRSGSGGTKHGARTACREQRVIAQF